MNPTALFKLLFKLLLTAVALAIVYRNIEINKTVTILKDVYAPGLLVSSILYILSKIVSAQRLNLFLQSEGIKLKTSDNLRLYLQGMFYNLFLPGGLGGDGYKAIFFKKNFGTSMKKSVRALLLDRISGVIALVGISSVFYLITVIEISWIGNFVAGISLILLYPAAFLVTHLLFKQHQEHFLRSSLYSLSVQGIQVASAFFILYSIGLQTSYMIYLGLFLVSTLFAILPITIGGIGARELAFVLASEFVGIDIDFAIAFSMLFFLMNALSSFPGIFIHVSLDKEIQLDATRTSRLSQ